MEKFKASLKTYFLDVLVNQYVDFKGRASRTQFWMFFLYVFVIMFVIGFIAGLLNMPRLAQLAILPFLLPNIAIAVRRIRDLGISGWFILVSFVPFVGSILVLIGYCLPTDFLKPYVEKLMKKN